MRIGTETNSLQNHLYSRMVVRQPEPEAGMGVTMLGWTDRSAGTIQRVFTVGKSTFIEVTDDTATRTDSNGMSECQEYSYTSNPDGYRSTYKREVSGKWAPVRKNPETNRWNKTGGKGLRLGERRAYHDYSF